MNKILALFRKYSILSNFFNHNIKYKSDLRRYCARKIDKFRSYNLLFLVAVSVPTLSIGLFNVAIDPYGVFNSREIVGINQAKPEKLKNMRLFKAVDITRIKPVTVFIGSSRTEYGLEPKHSALIDSQPAYNLGLGAATPYEMFHYLQHAIANQPKIQLVVIGLDEFMFNALSVEGTGFSKTRLEKKHLTIQDLINTTFSFTALTASRKTLEYSQKYPYYKSYSPEGRLNLRPIDRNGGATEYRFANNISVYFRVYPEYKISQRYLSYLAKIINLCQEKKIETKVFISPSHAARWEIIHAARHWQTYEQLKRELVKLTPIWDFSGYNSITTETISNNMKNYIDDSHYRKEIGDLVLNRLLSYQEEKVPDDFGILLTVNNIETHLAKIRADRQLWLSNNPQEVELVRNVQLKVKKSNK